MAVGARRSLQVRLGFASETGKRPDNQDYVAACLGDPAQGTARGIVAAVADGVGGHKGGREASELAIRGFIDAYYALPETLGIQLAASRALEAVNNWIHAQGRNDPELSGMSCTFSGLILAQRSCHIVHIGDSRVYRLSEDCLERLTEDHVAGRGDFAHVLQRAIGFEEFVRFDHSAIGLRQHDRFLVCTDGVHGALSDARLKALLGERTVPEESAQAVVDAALTAGGQDNATALVLDVVDLPPADQDELMHAIAGLPILDLPPSGATVDGFLLGEILSDGRYSRMLRASDTLQGRAVVLKFPHPRVASEGSYRLAFVREAWVATRVRSLWIGEIIELPAGRQTRLYSVMPFYDGETLERRLKRSPRLTLTEGVGIATKLAGAVATLHRSGIIHRDIKPDNVILPKSGGLRLVDLGVARVPRLEDFPAEDIPGTPSYMAQNFFREMREMNSPISTLSALRFTACSQVLTLTARSSHSCGRAFPNTSPCHATGPTFRRGSTLLWPRPSTLIQRIASATSSSSFTSLRMARHGPSRRQETRVLSMSEIHCCSGRSRLPCCSYWPSY